VNPSDELSYPRPQLRRESWRPLDGLWDFARELHSRWSDPREVIWERKIRVPFAPETPASGIGETGYYEVCWYRLVLPPTPVDTDQRLVLRFCAVDHTAEVWINGCRVVRHRGGYTPFAADITEYAGTSEPIIIVVRAEDDPTDLSKPRGKQDWQLDPHSIWYPRTSGIWQTVWLEWVPDTRIETLRWIPNLERWEIGLEAVIRGTLHEGLSLAIQLRGNGMMLASDVYSVVGGEVSRRIALSDPGIDDYRNELLWSPDSPTLIEARLELRDSRGRVLDRVASYTGLRSISVHGHVVLLNGRPYPLRFVLDQGYWPESGLTAPDGEALRRDVQLVKAMGFNGVRKHQKVEDPRYLYWADRMGLLVWVEMPSAYRFTKTAIERSTREWLEVIQRDYSHPCVAAWVPFNESWGVPNLPEIPAQRHFVQALYHLTKSLDSTRPVIGNDGWESAATDIIGIHDYDAVPQNIANRYRMHETHLFGRERPGGRILLLEGHGHAGQPLMLSEFGGIAYRPGASPYWGYSVAPSTEVLEARYRSLLEAVREIPTLAGFCYTQFADTYQEANGLLFSDRTPKFPLESIAEATRGIRIPRKLEADEPGSPHRSREGGS
jgi:beta-galactosidase/beta-glucuronidase